jgi:hypothetical protein
MLGRDKATTFFLDSTFLFGTIMENLQEVRKKRWDRRVMTERAIKDNPQKLGENQHRYAIRIAGLCGGHKNYVIQLLDRQRCEAIGEAKRMEERQRLVPISWDSWEVGPVKDFKGWLFEFGRLKAVVEAYLTYARMKQCVYAEAFLMNIHAELERGQKRAMRQTEVERGAYEY